MSGRDHWQGVYSKKPSDKVSWYRPHLDRSLALINSCNLGPNARIVDAGGGAATLVDDLLADGYHNVTVIDLAESALAVARERLGARASSVEWIAGDATTELLPPASVDLWHDRAVFHFLTEDSARAAYVAQVERCVKPGGYVLVATFALDGPDKCSGLPVTRYDPDGIRAAFGESFSKSDEAAEQHETPRGTVQSFAYCLCRRSA